MENHFKHSVVKGAKLFQCKYCQQTFKVLQICRARAHLSGLPRGGIKPCTNPPPETKELLLPDDASKRNQNADALRKKEVQARLAKEQRELDHCAQNVTKRQMKMTEWQKNRAEVLDLAFTRFLVHAGITFLKGKDELLQEFVDQLVAAAKSGLS